MTPSPGVCSNITSQRSTSTASKVTSPISSRRTSCATRAESGGRTCAHAHRRASACCCSTGPSHSALARPACSVLFEPLTDLGSTIPRLPRFEIDKSTVEGGGLGWYQLEERGPGMPIWVYDIYVPRDKIVVGREAYEKVGPATHAAVTCAQALIADVAPCVRTG